MADQARIKAALRIMRDRNGPASPEQRAAQKQLMAARKAIRAALAAGPATVPKLAAQAGLSTADTLWHVTAMRKFGDVLESGQDGDYPQYALAAEDDATGSKDAGH